MGGLRKVAVVSDIHGNLEALNRVLDDIQKEGIEEIICLGDTFGYGPNQLECWEITKNFSTNIYGNHEGLIKAKLIDKRAKLSVFGVRGSGAEQSIDLAVEQLMGMQKKKSAFSDNIIILPEEELESIGSDEYKNVLTELLVQKADDLKIEPPEISRLRIAKTLEKEIHDEIGYSFITHMLTEKPELVEEYVLRMQRRNKVLELYGFLTGLESKTTHQIGNAFFVHDDPLNPGSGKYLVDEKKADKIGVKIVNQVKISKIKKENLPDPNTDYILVGHSHALPGTVNANGVNIIYAGSVGIPRKDNLLKKYACYTILTFNDEDKVVNIEPKRLLYFWEKTQKKMLERGLVDKFESK